VEGFSTCDKEMRIARWKVAEQWQRRERNADKCLQVGRACREEQTDTGREGLRGERRMQNGLMEQPV